jgi:hypothetical protein
MTTFTIDSDSNITAYAELPSDADKAASFSTEKQFGKLTADWPISRLVDTWNGFAGVVPFDELRPVKKFSNRKAAVPRIWKAIQRLAETVAEPAKAANAAPQVAHKASKAKGSKTKAKAEKAAPTTRDGSKSAEVLDLLRRKQGATLTEIMEATAWKAHTVRGFISLAMKKQNLKIESFRGEDKQRTYRILA